jgi:hypothetical protein
MSELDDAIARLEAAVARLDAATDPARRPAGDARAPDRQVMDAAAAISGRIDAALAKLAQLLERED